MANVLIVEDDALLSNAYKLILDKEGHKVRTAGNGEEALTLVKEDEPEIILLDLLMPVMGGLTFLEKYDILGKKRKTVVVILSNLGDEKEIERGLALGAYKYIVKAQATPIQLSMLVNNLISKNLTRQAS